MAVIRTGAISLIFGFCVLLGIPATVCGLSPKSTIRTTGMIVVAATNDNRHSQSECYHRRGFLAASSSFAATLFVTTFPKASMAADDVAEATPPPSPPTPSLRDFKPGVGPDDYFEVLVPKRFFTLRRSAKGDLPDESTGTGRRGATLFSSGDLSKAEIVGVERFPTRLLLEENGMSSENQDLSSFPKLGQPQAIANLINQRRERDKPGMSVTKVDGAEYSADGMELTFRLKTEIDVQKPEMLMETYGVDRLFRITLAKASLAAKDDNILAIFASALEPDFYGADGETLKIVVDSFKVKEKSTIS